MLERKITTKNELIKLLQQSDIQKVMVKDIHVPDDLNDVKKAGLLMMRYADVTAIVLSN